MDPLERAHLRARGAHFVVVDEQAGEEWAAIWRDHGLPVEPVPTGQCLGGPGLGNPRLGTAFLHPDSVLAYPGLLADVQADAVRRGARLIKGATVTRIIRERDRAVALVYRLDGREIFLRCRHCVVAAGAWAPPLLSTAGLKLPVASWKSNVLTLDGELVPRITAFIGDRNLTLVPFQGRTLIADSRRFPADSPLVGSCGAAGLPPRASRSCMDLTSVS